MRRIFLLTLLLALCSLPAAAAPPAPLEVVWLQGNPNGQYAYLTITGNVLELTARGGSDNASTIIWVDAPPSQIAVSACGQRVYIVAVVNGEAVPLGKTLHFALPCDGQGVTLWLPLVSR